MRYARKKFLSPSELLDLITSNQWANSKDVYLISGRGKNQTNLDRSIMKEQLENKGYKLPQGLLPMDVVIDFYKINIPYLKKIVNINKN